MNRALGDAPSGRSSEEIASRGWYLYGVTERIPSGTAADWISERVGIEGEPVSAVDIGGLTAIVTAVSVANYSPEVLSTRASDAAWLEAAVRGHNDVIDAIHAQETILPAKFGSVYAQIDDLQRALEPADRALLAQLQRLRGTDEWAVHVYADRAAIENDVAAHDSNVLALRGQLAEARPGRAFFLQRKLADELAAATDAAMHQAAEEVYDHLGTHALEVEATPAAPATRGETGKLEILRAAFLVRRDDANLFLEAAGMMSETHPGLEVEVTGPWPLYSFVSSVAQETS